MEEEKVAQIIEAGRVAPTALNKQPQRFLLIQSDEGLEKLKKGVNFHGAPLAIIVCGESSDAWVRPYDNKNMAEIDAAIATDHMMMEAQSLGLGTCWLTYFDPQIIRDEFKIPENLEAVNILAIGYSDDEKPQSPERHSQMRKSVGDILFYETF